MSTHTTNRLTRRLVLLLAGLTALLVVIFILVDQSIALALFVGIFLGILVKLSTGIPKRRLRILVLILIGIVLVVFVGISGLSQLGPTVVEQAFGPIISGLDGPSIGEWPPCEKIQITAVDLSNGGFDVSQEQTTKLHQGQQSGLVLKELSFHTLPDFQCVADQDDPMTVELVDFPRNVFFDARGANDVKRTTYLNSETITWQQTNSQIRFSYLPRGLRFLKQPLAFFYGIGSIGEAVMSVLGFVGTFAVSAIIQPTFEEMLRERLKKWIGSRRKGQGEAKTDQGASSTDAESEQEPK